MKIIIIAVCVILFSIGGIFLKHRQNRKRIKALCKIGNRNLKSLTEKYYKAMKKVDGIF